MVVEGNPYSNILKLMKAQGYNKNTNLTIGKVSSISPLQFEVSGFELEKDDYYMTETLSQKVLAVNDLVLVIRDENDFFIIDRVVS